MDAVLTILQWELLYRNNFFFKQRIWLFEPDKTFRQPVFVSISKNQCCLSLTKANNITEMCEEKATSVKNSIS